MAKRRTKKQKLSATRVYEYSWSDASEKPKVADKSSYLREKTKSYELYAYDVALVKRDLVKTLIVSGIILGLEILLYYYW